MPMHNSARAAVEAQCYLNRKRQNISKEDLERVKAFAELYKPRASNASGIEECSRGTKRSRPSPLRRSPPSSSSSSAIHAYPSPSPSPSPSPPAPASSFTWSNCTTPVTSPTPQSVSFTATRQQSLHDAQRANRLSSFATMANVIREWVVAFLAMLSALSAWWSSTTAWFTFMFTATFGAVCNIKSTSNFRPAHGQVNPKRPRLDGQRNPHPPTAASASCKNGFLRVAGSDLRSKSITHPKTRSFSLSESHDTPHQRPSSKWTDGCSSKRAMPSSPCSGTAIQHTSHPVRIEVRSVLPSKEVMQSRRVLASFGYEVEAYETFVEDNAWDVKVAQCLVWEGTGESFGAALNAALDCDLTHLAIANGNLALGDIIAILYSCPSLNTLDVSEIDNLNPTRRFLPQSRYCHLPRQRFNHNLSSLLVGSAVNLDPLFRKVVFSGIKRLSLWLRGSGADTTISQESMGYMIDRALQQLFLSGSYSEPEARRIISSFPQIETIVVGHCSRRWSSRRPR
ncbi:hypothetical protein BKA70DRAFT_75094 [Coprinopsis sp. MPI-PUGE-AT-0042]|nr:hypothetical protein BKA70DRAFT_75094 [Coprinopsis sp. MPI-PUGE-AT-0042]